MRPLGGGPDSPHLHHLVVLFGTQAISKGFDALDCTEARSARSGATARHLVARPAGLFNLPVDVPQDSPEPL